MEGGHHYWIIPRHEARWPPKRSFIYFGSLLNSLRDHHVGPSYVFPSLTNDTHIVGPMNEITHAFDHLLTQLALVGLKVKVSKCKHWSPAWISLSIEVPQGCTLVTNGLCILGVPVDLNTFWMRLYLRTWCILMIFFSYETHRLLWAFCLHVSFIDLFISLR